MRCRMAVCRAEQPGGFAVTAGVAGQSGEALEDVGNAPGAPRCRRRARARRGRRARPAPAHPRDRHPGARRQRQHPPPARCRRDGLVGPAAGGGEIPVCQRGLAHSRCAALPPRHQSRHSGAARTASRASCAAAPSPAARAANANAVCPITANLPPSSAPPSRAASAAARAAATSPWRASARLWLPRLITLEDLVVSRLGLGRHLGELCGGSGQITL